ncbi:NIPSNAP family protein [Ancylobacter sp. 6x-1]|uniref:NIPSNAP family protein n=1 Tax=Ancylobacter crimeensis TaxID=2579147 RepID=A0ABT0DE56_9HYPH|nr:NIPSNAP family protein [Ancylobacter crimeensis]MCK0198154.1 NIPSNAP family protein [Ancylobacter crimeensis]
MIYEMRTYRLKTGTVPTYVKLVAEEGIAIQKGHLGQLVGYFFSDIGSLNEIVHIWAYSGLDDRAERRAALNADPAWLAFLPKIQALIETMENKILLPTAFSPLA